MATTTGEPELTPIKFSRLTRRGVLLGLSGPQLAMASLASGTLIIGLYVGAVVMTFPIILFLVALAFVGVGGRKLIEWAPIGASVAVAIRWRATAVSPANREAAAGRHAGAARRCGSAAAMGRPRDRRRHGPRPARCDPDRDHRRLPPRVRAARPS